LGSGPQTVRGPDLTQHELQELEASLRENYFNRQPSEYLTTERGRHDLADHLLNRMQIASSRVIAKSLPRVEDVTLRSPGQGGEICEAAEPFIIIRDNGGNLSLLEHELRNEDGVRIASLAPGQGAAMAAIPTQKRAMERVNVLRRGHDLPTTFNIQRPTLNSEGD